MILSQISGSITPTKAVLVAVISIMYKKRDRHFVTFLNCFSEKNKYVNDFCRKLLFPYSSLDQLVCTPEDAGDADDAGDDFSVNVNALQGPIPPRESFKNELLDIHEADSLAPSQEKYEVYCNLMSELGVSTLENLVSLYNILDVLQTIMVLKTINRFYYQEFRLTIFRYGSLSRFGFDLLMLNCLREKGGGVDFIHDPRQREFLKQAVFGGFQVCAENGGLPEKKMNNTVECPHFDVTQEQKKTLSLDVNALFVHVLSDEKMPKSDYAFHDQDSLLVKQMNNRLSVSQSHFAEHYGRVAMEDKTCFLIKAKIRYPPDVHQELESFCPTFSRRVVETHELSAEQLTLMEQMGLNPDFKQSILVADLHPQVVTITHDYLFLLIELGAKIDEVLEVMTAFETDMFQKAAKKFLQLKQTASTSYFRKLSKLLGELIFFFLFFFLYMFLVVFLQVFSVFSTVFSTVFPPSPL